MNPIPPTRPPGMVSDHTNEPSRQQLISSWVDGEIDAADDVVGHWHGDEAARTAWHRFHLIGDVMRSEDLASTPQRDGAFLVALRARLAQEAPASSNVIALVAPDRARSSPRWLAPAAVAAGFVAVAGVIGVTRYSAPGIEHAPAASVAVQSIAPGLQRAAVGAASQSMSIELMDAAVIRDAQIDRYFRAHRDMRATPAAASPGGALRSVDTIVPQR